MLEEVVATLDQPEGFQRVGETDLGEIAAAARAGEGTPQRVELLTAGGGLALELRHRLADMLEALEELLGRLTDELLAGFLRLGALALVVLEQFRGNLLRRLEHRCLVGFETLLLEPLEIAELLAHDRELAQGGALGSKRRFAPRRRIVPLRCNDRELALQVGEARLGRRLVGQALRRLVARRLGESASGGDLARLARQPLFVAATLRRDDRERDDGERQQGRKHRNDKIHSRPLPRRSNSILPQSAPPLDGAPMTAYVTDR